MKLNKSFFVIAVLLGIALISCASGGGNAAWGPPWNFETAEGETMGWRLANEEFYQYHGPISMAHDDSTFGYRVLRLDVDFSKSGELEWSEPKMANDLPRSYQMKGKTKFCFDFYYDPSLHSEDGHFKAKVFTNNNININSAGEAIEGGEDMGNGFVKAPVEILIMPVSGFLTDLRFSIAGYMTTYTGAVFVGNMRWE